MSSRTPDAGQISNFLKDLKVLIAEPSGAFSTAIQQILQKLGCNIQNIYKESSFERAVQCLRQKPDIIISEYQLGNNFGLELAEKQSQYIEDETRRIFVLATYNGNDSAIAEAAEEEIDGYILKPFTLSQMQDLLASIIARKIQPSPYTLKIAEGKQHLLLQEYSLAIPTFQKAKELDQKPSLACYYYGFSNKEIQNLDLALDGFREGRKFNPLHYKCLQGEFDVLFLQNKRKEAYEVLKVINENFPVSPQTLEKMFMLAILTNNYKDVENHYSLFVKLDRRPDQLLKVVAEALFFAGRFYLKDADVPSALELFKKGASVTKRSPQYLNKVVKALLKENLNEVADEVINMFAFEDQGSFLFAEVDFELSKRILKPHEVIEKGKRLIAEGLATPEICDTVIKSLVEQDRMVAAEQISYKASRLFPELKNQFYSWIKAA